MRKFAMMEQRTIRQGQRVRIGELWYRVVYPLPRPLLDEGGNPVDLLLDRFGSLEYGNSEDVTEWAAPTLESAADL